MLNDTTRGDSPFALPGPVVAYVVVDDPDALHDRALAAGAEIVMRLTDTDYGSGDFAARDPGGNVWSFGTHRPSVSRAPPSGPVGAASQAGPLPSAPC